MLRAGDLSQNYGGTEDIAVGTPNESTSSLDQYGSVHVIYGGTNIDTSTADFLHQSNSAIPGTRESYDHFGYALAAGDFDNNGFDDLAIGVPDEDTTSGSNTGVVNVLYGYSGGLWTSAASGGRAPQVWSQSGAVEGSPEAGDRFGAALASADYDTDNRDDLAVGVPNEDSGTIVDAGAVNVIYGSGTGLTTTDNEYFDQGPLEGGREAFDRFGQVLG